MSETHHCLHHIDAFFVRAMCLRRIAFLFQPVFNNELIYHVAAREAPVREDGILRPARPIQKIRRPQQALASLTALAQVLSLSGKFYHAIPGSSCLMSRHMTTSFVSAKPDNIGKVD